MARVAGAYVTGFGTGMVITMPFDPDFSINLIRSLFAGLLTALPQLKKVLDEYGHGRRR